METKTLFVGADGEKVVNSEETMKQNEKSFWLC